MKYQAKTLLSLVIVLGISISFQRAEAAISFVELQREIGVVSIMVSNLSQDIQSGRISPEAAKSEIQRISQIINSLMRESSLFSQGQVLGAYSSGRDFAPVTSSREAVVVLEPISGSSVVRMNIGNTFSNTLLSFSVKSLRSDIEVRRIDVTFDERIWRYVGEITLSAGGKILARIDPQHSDFFENAKGEYTLRFGGFSYFIPMNSTRTVTLTMKPRDRSSSAGEIFDAKVFLNNGALRAVDEANIQHSLPSQHGGSNGSFSRKFEIVY